MFGKKHPDKFADAPRGDEPRARGVLPYALAGVAVGLALLTIGTAGLVAYDRATSPAWRQPADATGEAEQGAGADQDAEPAGDAEVEEAAEADAAAPAEEAPAVDEAPAEEAAEPPFVRTAREELGVPDDPSITYEIGEPYYWEGVGMTVTPITFYKGGVVCASADCSEDGSPATTILHYPGNLGS